jgi:hypothetical protein
MSVRVSRDRFGAPVKNETKETGINGPGYPWPGKEKVFLNPKTSSFLIIFDHFSTFSTGIWWLDGYF